MRVIKSTGLGRSCSLQYFINSDKSLSKAVDNAKAGVSNLKFPKDTLLYWSDYLASATFSAMFVGTKDNRLLDTVNGIIQWYYMIARGMSKENKSSISGNDPITVYIKNLEGSVYKVEFYGLVKFDLNPTYDKSAGSIWFDDSEYISLCISAPRLKQYISHLHLLIAKLNLNPNMGIFLTSTKAVGDGFRKSKDIYVGYKAGVMPFEADYNPKDKHRYTMGIFF